VHGSDDLGNISMHPPNNKKVDRNTFDFMVDKVSEFPNDMSILALGPMRLFCPEL
jgi:inosine-uridine nucleoside N-ribohydrolase